MEIEQLIKQVDWVDEEQRKEKLRLNTLDERLAAAESNIPSLVKQIKDMGSELTRLTTIISRMDTFDETLMQQRIETKQYFDELERLFKKGQDESEKMRRVEMRALETSLAELRKELDQFPEVKRSLKARVEEESPLEPPDRRSAHAVSRPCAAAKMNTPAPTACWRTAGARIPSA